MEQTVQKPKKKKARLTKKQQEFIAEYIKTGNGQQAALKTYDIQSNDPENVARSIASENLTKPNIISAIDKAMDDEFLAKQHRGLFEQKRIDYFVFPKTMSDEEIKEHVESVGITVITVRMSDKGKMAFYSIKDAQAVKGALEMAYKIKGFFKESEAPRAASINTYNLIFSAPVQEQVNAINEVLKQRLLNTPNVPTN